MGPGLPGTGRGCPVVWLGADSAQAATVAKSPDENP